MQTSCASCCAKRRGTRTVRAPMWWQLAVMAPAGGQISRQNPSRLWPFIEDEAPWRAGLFIAPLLEAVPINKVFDMYKPGGAGPGGSIRIFADFEEFEEDKNWDTHTGTLRLQLYQACASLPSQFCCIRQQRSHVLCQSAASQVQLTA